MKVFDVITEDNYLLYAANKYSNPQCTSVEDFYDDLNRFKYLKRLFNRFYENDDLQERLILNHLIIIYNTFGIEGGHKLTFFRIEKPYWPALKTFLVYLNYLSADALVDVPLEPDIVTALRKI
jgi:hypothetical protein